MKLGYGTVSFFNFHEYMIILFIILVLCVAPGFWMFNEFDGGDRAQHSLTSRLSIAQLGFAKAFCKDTSLASGFLNIVCYTG